MVWVKETATFPRLMLVNRFPNVWATASGSIATSCETQTNQSICKQTQFQHHRNRGFSHISLIFLPQYKGSQCNRDHNLKSWIGLLNWTITSLRLTDSVKSCIYELNPIRITFDLLMFGLGWRFKVQIKLITNEAKPNWNAVTVAGNG
jgi:hypothetical protein